DGRGDDPGIDPSERVVAEAQTLDRPRPEVLDDDVGAPRHPLEEGASPLGLQIERDALLVGIEHEEEPRVRVGPLRERASPRLAGLLAACRLSLSRLGYVVYAEKRIVCARALKSVTTLTTAGLPEAHARSSAGRISWGFSTSSPCAPKSCATLS